MEPSTSASSRNPFAAAAALLESDVVTPDAQSLLERLGRLWIRTKQSTEVQFRPNAVQRDIAERMYSRRGEKTKLLVLKARQVGVSTFCQANAYTMTTTERLRKAATVSAEAEATKRLGEMQKFFLSRDPASPATKYNSINSVTYTATESSHYIGTAGSKSFGRGDTLNFIHCSELAFWPHAEDLLTGLLQALVPDGTVVIESTPNGRGGHFYDLWSNAPDNGWTPLFYPWWWEPGYRATTEAALPLSEEEERLIAEHGLDLRQIAWRREKQRELRDKFPQEYPENPTDCFLASGRIYFAKAGLRAQEVHIRPPLSDEDGLAVWAEYDPSHVYVIGADVAEGLEGGDFSVAQVVDITTGEQVARLRGHWPTSHFARLLAKLGHRYGEALLAPERNNHGNAVLDNLTGATRYDNLYRYFEFDPLMDTDQKHRWGWLTTTSSKPVMLSDLDAALFENGIKVRDRRTLDELGAMAWDGKGGVSAIEGAHDDCVMALAIAWQARKQPGSYAAAMGYFDERNADPAHAKAYAEYLEQLKGAGVEGYLKEINALSDKEA